MAVINPHRRDCHSKLTHLAGVGVAFYFLIQLRKTLRENNFFINKKEPNLAAFLDLVAIGTIADIVPLVKENRIFTKKGLDLLRKNSRLSLKELSKSSGLDSRKIGSQDIAFNIAPRINSAGRIDNAKKCVDLLCSQDIHEIKNICNNLNQLNNIRKKEEEKIVKSVTKQIEESKTLDKILIYHSEEWSQGILGTAASKIVKKFNRPCILLSKDETVLKGSARSIQGFSIYDFLKYSENFLDKFGGHSQAAGLSMNSDKLEELAKSANLYGQKNLSQDNLTPVNTAEDVITFDDLSKSFLTDLDLMEPFGLSNPYPLFISKNIIIEKNISIKNLHARLSLYQPCCTTTNRLLGFIFNINTSLPSHLKQILIRPVPDRHNKEKANLFIEAWE